MSESFAGVLFSWPRLRAGIGVCVVAALSGCPLIQQPKFKPPEIAGFRCLPTPSEWNAAGSVIGINESGTPFQLGSVPGIVPAYGSGAIGAHTKDSSVEAGLALQTLESYTENKGWSANIGANLKSTLTIVTSFGGETRMAVTEGQPEDIALRWFKANKYKVEDGFKYYLVREAYQAKEVHYEVISDDLAKLGGRALFKAIEGKFNVVDFREKGNYVLKATMSSFVNVCIKPRELFVAGRSSSGEQFLGFRDPTGRILSVQ